MDEFKNIIVTEIEAPIVVHSETGRKLKMVERESYGISLCYSGQITYKMNGKTFVSKPDVALFHPQGATYDITGDKDGLFPLINFYCRDFLCDELKVIPLKNPQACLKLFEAAKSGYNDGDHLKTFSHLYALFDEVFSENVKKHGALASAIKYVDEHLESPELSNTEIANHLGISEVYLRKLFLSHCGTTPRQYILDLRLRKAKELLVDTPLSVCEIAEECGFSSVYHFCRTFKGREGQTPTQYAAANRIYKI